MYQANEPVIRKSQGLRFLGQESNERLIETMHATFIEGIELVKDGEDVSFDDLPTGHKELRGEPVGTWYISSWE